MNWTIITNRSKRAINCMSQCTENLVRPVCGNDGITYRNRCELQKVVNCQGKDVKFQHDGECFGKIFSLEKFKNLIEFLEIIQNMCTYSFYEPHEGTKIRHQNSIMCIV